jgi:hypothetical protein
MLASSTTRAAAIRLILYNGALKMRSIARVLGTSLFHL